MIEPADFDPEDTPSTKLFGLAWPLPEMPFRQLIAIWDDMQTVTAALERTGKPEILPDDAPEAAKVALG
jgi:hypothetical protein